MTHRAHIGPEYGFGFAIDAALEEKVLIIKTAWGGKTLCGDFRPPSSCNATSKPIGFYCESDPQPSIAIRCTPAAC